MSNSTAIGAGALCNASDRMQLGSSTITSIGFGTTVLTTNQIKQLSNLPNTPAILIQPSMWLSLAGLNQPLSTSSSPTFANLTVRGTLSVGSVGITTIRSSVRTITINVPLDDSYSIVEVDATAGPVVVTLPRSGLAPSLELKIVKADTSSNIVVVARYGSDKIGYNYTFMNLTMLDELVHLIDGGSGNWQLD
jgi:hypothetical protein